MTTPPESVDPFKLVAEALNRRHEEITEESGIYRDHGWDSFGHIAVLLSLEAAYGISIDDAQAEKYKTMRAILELHERFRSGENV